MNNKILSNEEISDITSELSDGADCLERGISALKNLIKQFEDEEIVQTFFSSGNFGKEKQENIKKIVDILDREKSNILDNLVPTTEKFLVRQSQLNESGVQ